MDRRSFVVAGLCASVPAALSLCGCSFSLRDFLHSDTKIWRSEIQNSDGEGSDDLPSEDLDPNREEPLVPEATQDAQYGFWMDSASCVGCASCVDACREKSGLAAGAPDRRTLYSYGLEDGSVRLVSISCMHCAKPACMEVCPAGAISKRTDGIVVVDRSRCIGCRYCRQACPFGAPHYAADGMDKCDCCLGGGVRPGADPHCVRACPTQALRYGTLDDLIKHEGCPDSLLQAPTGPSFFLS